MTFGTFWPYTMPPSERGWLQNVGDLASAQLGDLGLPAAVAEALPAATLPQLLVLLFAGLALAFWATRRQRATHLRLAVLAGYAGCGAVLLVASRSRYEWGNLIDDRNVLQYSFAFALAFVVALGALLPARGRRLAVFALCALLAVRALESTREALAARVAPPESWLELSRDQALMDRARSLPPLTLVASNAAVLFRIGAPRAVRQLDVGGDDRDFAGSLALLADAARPRPTAFLLVCNEWTWRFAACQGHARPQAAECTLLRSAPPRVAECALGAAGEPASTSPAATGSGTDAGPDPS
jgi:hypothetical protein